MSATAIDRLARKCRVRADQVQDAYPCTSLQAGLVAASLQDLGDYVSRFVFKIPGHDLDDVKSAFEKVYESNAILRTRIIENSGQLIQVVIDERVHWGDENDSLQRYIQNDRGQKVGLGRPLARFGVIRERDGAASSSSSYMVWSLHHCQYDEWSFQMLVEDLGVALSGKTMRRRTPFSKFIKALGKIDNEASLGFWRRSLGKRSRCQSVCSSASSGEPFRTSRRLEASYPLSMPKERAFQPSVLAVAAWSLLLARLSGSSTVLFGNVLNGRTSDLEGIQEICGPTLATVPWCTDIAYDDTVRALLDQTQQARLELLPFEQTGLTEYRKQGTAAFDTLLSVRSSQENAAEDEDSQHIQPERPDPSDLNHPCAIFLEVEMSPTECTCKASYDARVIDANMLSTAMEKFVASIAALSNNLDRSLKHFEGTLELPTSVELPATSSQSDTNNATTGSEAEGQSSDMVDNSLLDQVKKLALQATGVKKMDGISPDTTLMQLGMDSLRTVVLSRHLSKKFNVDVPFKEIAGPGRTILSIASSVQRALTTHNLNDSRESSVSLLDLADAQIRSLSPVQAHIATQTENSLGQPAILLTGATGYLGIEILRQLLNHTSDKIVLLVRCGDIADGIERVRKTAEIAAWDTSEIESLESRIDVWPSDLARERLGLGDEHWTLLTGDNPSSSSFVFKAIIHNGAKVDFLHSYDDLKDANVRSTAILLDQHIKSWPKSNFVLVTGGRPCPVEADDVQDTSRKLASAPGYAQTKFVSEVLVHKTKALYSAAGLSASMSIVHPGSIIGSVDTGVANLDDFIWRYVAASRSMNCYAPAVPTRREWINLTPVDGVAAIVVGQATQKAESDGVQRCLVRGGLPVSLFWTVIVEVLAENGVHLRPVSEWEWMLDFEADIGRKGSQQPLFALSQLLLQGQLQGIGGQSPFISKTELLPDTAMVAAAVRSNARYLWQKGFFEGDGGVSKGSGIFVRSKA